ncbi:uncharacterized protein METZ01_LOCUS455782, partial [marine metagenome]
EPEEENDSITNSLTLSDFGINDLKTISLYGEVEENICHEIISFFYNYKALIPKEEIKSEKETIDFIVSTEGGNVQDMFAIYDCMRDIKKECDIQTYGVGKVMSAGVLLLAGGTKGKRKIGKHCRLMLHAVSGGHFGSLNELEVDIKEVRWYQTQFIRALAKETKLSQKKVREIFYSKTDTYFDAQQALKWGMVDEVV